MRAAFILLILGLWARSAGSRDDVGEHLPKAAKPPAFGQLPAGLAPYGTRVGGTARPAFDGLIDEALATLLRLDPVRATELGFHQYDAMLPAADSSGMAERHAALAALESRARTVELKDLDPARRDDHEHLLRALHRARAWGRDPADYVDVAHRGVQSLVSPSPERASNVIARVNAIAPLLRDARAALERDALSRVELEGARSRSRALLDYLANTLPVDMNDVKDPVLREEFDHHLAQAAGGAADYYDWLTSRTPTAPDPLPVEWLGADPLPSLIGRRTN